ncbi:MAG: hypothetical protein AABX13_00070 [Nanoarchaeota archaeon]
MKVIADTGALLSLSCSRYFPLLRKEHALIITPAVQQELQQFSQYRDVLGRKAQEIIDLKLVSIIPLRLLALSLESAEKEVFSVAKEKGYLALTDDVHAARVLWEKEKLAAKPSFYLLLLLYQKKKITKENFVEDVKATLRSRNWLQGALGDYALKLMEEME